MRSTCARVARQEAAALQRHAELRIDLDERARDAVAHRAGLARGAAAVDAHAQVVLPSSPAVFSGAVASIR